jgi:hypothetical protein
VTVLVSIPQGLTLLRRKSATEAVQVMLFWGGGFKLLGVLLVVFYCLDSRPLKICPSRWWLVRKLYSRFREYTMDLCWGIVQDGFGRV